MSHRWVIEKIDPRVVKIHDLGFVDAKGKRTIQVFDRSREGSVVRYELHRYFTWEQLCASKGLIDAEKSGWIRTVEVIPPTTVTADTQILQTQIANLTSLVEQLVTGGVVVQAGGPAVASGQVKQINQDHEAALAAVKAFGKMGGTIESSLDGENNAKVVQSNAGDLAKFLSNIHIDDEIE